MRTLQIIAALILFYLWFKFISNKIVNVEKKVDNLIELVTKATPEAVRGQ